MPINRIWRLTYAKGHNALLYSRQASLDDMSAYDIMLSAIWGDDDIALISSILIENADASRMYFSRRPGRETKSAANPLGAYASLHGRHALVIPIMTLISARHEK